jgi:hypothetical protein
MFRMYMIRINAIYYETKNNFVCIQRLMKREKNESCLRIKIREKKSIYMYDV